MFRPGLALSTGGALLVLAWTVIALYAAAIAEGTAGPVAFVTRFVLAFALSCVVLTLAAGLIVRWHRLLLLDSAGPRPQRFSPRASDAQCAALLFACALTVHALFALLDVSLGVGLGLHETSMAFLVARVALAVGLLYLLCRFGLVLPAVALGRRLRLEESWRATAGRCHSLFIPLATMGLGFWAVGQAATWLSLPPMADHLMRGTLVLFFLAGVVAGLSSAWRRTMTVGPADASLTAPEAH